MEKKLIKYLNELKTKANDSHPTKKLKDLYSCYSKGGVSESYNDNVGMMKTKTSSTNNVLKSIVDTVSTFVLDNQLTKEVVLRSMSFSDVSNL